MRTLISLLSAVLFLASRAQAQSFEAGVNFASAKWSEYDNADPGIGSRLTWRPLPLIGIDADFTWYPTAFPESRASFSDNRIEGLFGVTIGPRLGPVRPFVKAGAGFMHLVAPDEGLVCVAIYPPPLACVLPGKTLPDYELGGGVSIDVSSRTFIRADIADRILKYPGPTFRFGLREI